MKKTLLFLPVLFGAVLLSGCSADSAPSVNTVVPTPPSQLSEPEIKPEKDSVSAPNVKKSSSGICHAEGTTYYSRTKNFTPYDSIDECLDSGGRMPLK